MIFSPVRAIAIDNNSLELISIVNGLAAQGIACSAHLFDSGELIPPPPPSGYSHVRLAFVDMNLQDLAGIEPKNVASIIVTVLGKAVAKNAGPYCLVFWTNLPEKVEEVRPYVLEQLANQGIPAPSLITHLGKAELIPSSNGAKDHDLNIGLRAHIEAQGELSTQLATSLLEVLSKAGSVTVTSAWETLLSEAASNAISALYDEAKKLPDVDPDTGFSDVLASIAVEAIGKKNAKDEPLHGLTAGLMELVLDQFRTATTSGSTEQLVKKQLGARIKGASIQLPEATVARVNRLFQVEMMDATKPVTRISRGLTARPTEDFLKLAGLEQAWSDFLWKEMLHDPCRLRADDPMRDELIACKPAVGIAVRPLLIEVGADCDHAQRKPRSHRFLLAAEVPHEHYPHFLASLAERRTPFVSDGIEVLGPWEIPNLAHVAVSCKRFFSLQSDNIPNGLVPLMRVRGALVDHLLHRYSTLATRPGFVALRTGK